MHQLFNEEFYIRIRFRKRIINYIGRTKTKSNIIIMHEGVQYEMCQRATATQLSGNSSEVAKKIQYNTSYDFL